MLRAPRGRPTRFEHAVSTMLRLTAAFTVLTGSSALGQERTELRFEKELRLPARLQEKIEAVSDIQIGDDGKYLFVTSRLSTAEEDQGRILVWNYPDGNFLAEIPIKWARTGRIGQPFVYFAKDERIAYMTRRGLAFAELKNVDRAEVIPVRPEHSSFDNYAVWARGEANSVVALLSLANVSEVPSSAVEFTTDKSHGQTLLFREKIPDLSFAAYLPPIDAVLVSWKVTEEYGIGIRRLKKGRTEMMSRDLPSVATGATATKDGKSVLIGCDSGELYRVDVHSMKVDWSVKVANFRIFSISEVDEGRSVVTSRDREAAISVLDHRRGSIVRTFTTNNEIKAGSQWAQVGCRLVKDRVLYAAATNSRVMVGSIRLSELLRSKQ